MYKTTILIADDNHDYRESLKKILNDQEDMEVIADTGNGEEAFELAMDLEPDFIIMDVNMPILSGDEATQKIKKDLFGVKILMISGNEYDGKDLETFRKHADGFLAKSSKTDEMLQTIRSLSKAKKKS
jgi:two-component system, NarL family, response regulator DegU